MITVMYKSSNEQSKNMNNICKTTLRVNRNRVNVTLKRNTELLSNGIPTEIREV
ncbi:hypothetical protein [Poseidonibacter ostreae]|uniref:hypothetical protein n=1 Tax=Poseidonibacter ostreae TaxID=2654171 RepID=UPI00186B547E|nr:hypothetical protein [Poseidonibacter ostreae]